MDYFELPQTVYAINMSVFAGGSVSYDLLYVWVPLIGPQQCEKTCNKGEFDETMLCAADDGKSPCQVSITSAKK